MLKAIDLFCGCGGFSLGFSAAGFDIVAGYDNDPEALSTFSKNFPSTISKNIDLNTISNDEIGNLKKIDVVLGGPPCQGFSIAGKKNHNDPRNKMIDTYIDIVKKLSPKAVVIENVPNILNLANGYYRKNIITKLEILGYKVTIEKLNAADFGVPQNRKRVFFLGLKSDYLWANEINNFKSNKNITCLDALDDLPTLNEYLGEESLVYRTSPQNLYQKQMRKNSKCVFNHISVDHTENTKHIISMVPDGGNYKDLPHEFQKTRRVNIAWTRMNSQKPCFTIDAGHNHHFHYKQNRVPTVRECARIQSFPDDFHFLGKRTSQYRQVGNAVPPILAEKIAYILINRI